MISAEIPFSAILIITIVMIWLFYKPKENYCALTTPGRPLLPWEHTLAWDLHTRRNGFY